MHPQCGLLKGLDGEFGAARLDRFLPVGLAFPDQPSALLPNVQPRRRLAASFPTLVHVLNRKHG